MKNLSERFQTGKSSDIDVLTKYGYRVFVEVDVSTGM